MASAVVAVGGKDRDDEAGAGCAGGSGGGMECKYGKGVPPEEGTTLEEGPVEMDDSASAGSFRLTTGRGRGFFLTGSEGDVDVEIELSACMPEPAFGRALEPNEEMSETTERFAVKFAV